MEESARSRRGRRTSVGSLLERRSGRTPGKGSGWLRALGQRAAGRCWSCFGVVVLVSVCNQTTGYGEGGGVEGDVDPFQSRSSPRRRPLLATSHTAGNSRYAAALRRNPCNCGAVHAFCSTFGVHLSLGASATRATFRQPTGRHGTVDPRGRSRSARTMSQVS